MEHTESVLSNASGTFSRYLARTHSRRTFLARVGQGGIAVALGSSGALQLAGVAQADGACNCGICPSNPSCCSNNSVTCLCLTNSNACPSGSCIGGCWWTSVPTSECSSGLREWCDCVAGCENPCGCWNCNGASTPRCCRHKTYSSRSQCGNGCNHIRCRRHRCIGSTFTVGTC
jgi:hypothetical protein